MAPPLIQSGSARSLESLGSRGEGKFARAAPTRFSLVTGIVSATGAGDLFSSFQPVTENPSALSLYGASRGSPAEGIAAIVARPQGRHFPSLHAPLASSHARRCSTRQARSVLVSLSQRRSRPVTTACSGVHRSPCRVTSTYRVFQTSDPLKPLASSNFISAAASGEVWPVRSIFSGSQNSSKIWASPLSSFSCVA